MKITILGSGTGAPSLNRNASGIVIKIANQHLLFDSGPGTVNRLLEVGITYHDIDYIFYSHFHTDHTLDLAALLFAAKYHLSLRTKQLNIIGPLGLERFYHNLLQLYGDAIEPAAFVVKLREIKEQTLNLNTYKIKTMRMQHCPESIGFRIEENGKAIVYSGDTDVCENIVRLADRADILILECSFPNEMKVSGHLTPQEAGKIAQECNCNKLVLSHLYPVCHSADILRQAKRTFRGEIVVANDLMVLNL